MAYNLKYDKLLRAIESGRQNEAVSFFERRVFDVNESIRYLFEDGKQFVVTPLYWAVRHNCPQVCKFLLMNGSRPYGTVVYEYYPLHEACNRGYDHVVQEFVTAGVELDKVNSDADTPLHVACMRGHIQCVHILLRAGSDCNLRNKLGHTPLQCAVYHDRTDLVELFRAHNKGIETTPPGVSSAHQRHGSGGGVGVQALGAIVPPSTGVKVQRSHSFNTAGSLSAAAERRVVGQARIRAASHERPQSYYENGANSSLVIGQAPISSFSSQSTLGLSSSSSGPSSYTTIPSHIPSTTYSSLSPDSPVELDAPKRSTASNEPTVHSGSLAHNKGKPPFPPPPPPPSSHKPLIPAKKAKSPSPWRYSKPDDDFGTGFETCPKLGESGGREQGASFKPLCPFPAPGGTSRKEPPERNISPPKRVHPLLATTRSDHHHHHHHHIHNNEKLFQERLSHPEFSIPKRDVQVTNRAKSSNDVFLGNCTRREDSDILPLPSRTREHIDSLACSLCSALDMTASCSNSHHHLKNSSSSSLPSSSPSSSSLHPLLFGLRESLGKRAHHFGLSPDHQHTLSQLPLPRPPPPLDTLSSSSSSSSSSLSSTHLPSFQELDFEVVEGPLESRVWSDDEGEGVGTVSAAKNAEKFATLLMKVQVCDPLVQLRSQMSQGDIVLLKVKVKLQSIDALGMLTGSLQGGNHSDHLPEATILNELPAHPNIAPMLYYCRGRTEKISNLLSELPPGDHHGYRCPDSMLLESHSHSIPGWNEDRHSSVTYSPAHTGTFLYQSASGVPLDKYFAEVVQRDSALVEEKFLLVLAQLLLAVAHLERNLIAHCAISSQSVYVSEKGGKVVLGDFGQAVCLRPKNLDIYRKSIKQLKRSKTRKLSPEAEERLRVCDAESAASTSSHAVQNFKEAFALSDSYAVGSLCYQLFNSNNKDQVSKIDDNNDDNNVMPFIDSLSFRSNHLLQKLVAQNPGERFSALQGAVSCFVLLFGPRTSEISTTGDTLHWLVAESLELYLDPVLQDSTTTGFHGDTCKRKLHYSYLSMASPELVHDSCKFFSNR